MNAWHSSTRDQINIKRVDDEKQHQQLYQIELITTHCSTMKNKNDILQIILKLIYCCISCPSMSFYSAVWFLHYKSTMLCHSNSYFFFITCKLLCLNDFTPSCFSCVQCEKIFPLFFACSDNFFFCFSFSDPENIECLAWWFHNKWKRKKIVVDTLNVNLCIYVLCIDDDDLLRCVRCWIFNGWIILKAI